MLYRCHEDDARLSGDEMLENSCPFTSLMIRHIPCIISKADLSSAIDDLGFKGKYDLLHLPRALSKKNKPKSNRGYAFVNFITEADTEAFTLRFQGYQFAGSRSAKQCDVQPAHVQGKDQMEATMSCIAAVPSATFGPDEENIYTGTASLVGKSAVRQAPKPSHQLVNSLGSVVEGKSPCLHEASSLPMYMKNGFPHVLRCDASASDAGSSTREPLSSKEEDEASQLEVGSSDDSSDSSSNDSDLELWMDSWLDPSSRHLEQGDVQLQCSSSERQHRVKTSCPQKDSIRGDIQHYFAKAVITSQVQKSELEGVNSLVEVVEGEAPDVRAASCLKVCVKNTFLHVCEGECKLRRSRSDSDLAMLLQPSAGIELA